MRLSFSAILPALLLASCATSPRGRSQFMLVGDARVERAAQRTFDRIKHRETLSENKEDQAFVRCVVEALNKILGRNWDVVIFKNDEANAFALPGNKLGVNTGLLRVTVNQDQLAAVIGHEMGHVIAEHGRERVSQQTALAAFDLAADTAVALHPKYAAASLVTKAASSAVQFGILYPFTRLQEDEADLIGLELMAKAGFRAEEALKFWSNMTVYAPQFTEADVSDHPAIEDRMSNLKAHLNSLPTSVVNEAPQCAP